MVGCPPASPSALGLRSIIDHSSAGADRVLVLHEIVPLGRCLGMILILAGTLTLGLSHE
jgi:hypothetical protein